MSLRTGDIVLFNERPPCGLMAIADWLIRTITRSEFSHVGIVVVDPPWTEPGTYVWDSSMHSVAGPEDPKPRFGIQLVRLDDYQHHYSGKQTLYKRSPVSEETYALFDNAFLTRIHDKVYGKHYDLYPSHWFAGVFHILIPRTTSTFFCSAFVSYCLCQAGVLDPDTDWTIVSPADLSALSQRLHWNLKYGPEKEIS